MVKTESGARLPASYRSGRFEEWSKARKVGLPKVGEEEEPGSGGMRGGRQVGKGGRTWKHRSLTAAKPLDRLSTGYERKIRTLGARDQANGAGGEEEESKDRRTGGGKKGAPPARGKIGKSKFGSNRPGGKVRSELKSVDAVRKAREAAARRKAKNARPSKKSGRR